MKHYYAISDSFTGDDPRNTTSGFANTKIAIAFRSRIARDAWLASTLLTTARACSRSEAILYTAWGQGEYYGSTAQRCKAIRIYNTSGTYDATDYVIVAESAN